MRASERFEMAAIESTPIGFQIISLTDVDKEHKEGQHCQENEQHYQISCAWFLYFWNWWPKH